jgi:hypothetical protein
VPPGFALVIGIGAGLGFALKHYFLVVPALLELWLFLRQRRRLVDRPAGDRGAGSRGLLYAGAILLFARDFLTVTLPMIRLAYGVTGAPALAQLFQPLLPAQLGHRRGCGVPPALGSRSAKRIRPVAAGRCDRFRARLLHPGQGCPIMPSRCSGAVQSP